MRILKSYSIVFFLLIINIPLWSDSLYDASVLEKNGEMDKAVDLYDLWLSENRTDPAFADILFHSASIIVSVDELLDFLFKYENFIENQEKQEYYAKIATVYELLFQNEKAAIYYKKAAINQQGIYNYKFYLKYLQVEYQMGKIPELSALNNMLLSNVTDSVYVDTLIFKAEILKYRGEISRAESLLQQSEFKEKYPELQLALWEIYLLQNNYAAISGVLSVMKSDFPRSIELSIMEDEIKKIPRLSDFFIQQDSSLMKSYIQVGSYRNEENIRIQSEKLKKKSFDFFYITEKNLTKIIVVDSGTAAALLNKLQLNGFSGFTIDYP